MRRFVFGFVFLCCAFCYQAQAIVPLEIKATLQLPNTAVWDVQHCADDTSFGYAYVLGDTIFWAERLGNEVQRYLVPLDSFPFADDYQRIRYNGLKLLHLQSRDNHLCLALQSEVGVGGFDSGCEHSWSTLLVTSIFDLDDNLMLGIRALNGSECSPNGNSGFYSTRVLNNLTVWPLPPRNSSLIVFSQLVDFHSWWPAFPEDAELQTDNGYIYYSNMQESPFVVRQNSGGRYIAAFADFDQRKFMYTGLYRHAVNIGSASSSTWFGLIDFSNTPVRDSLLSCMGESEYSCQEQRLVPQHDANGTNRIISPGGYAVSATQFDDTLWHNPAITGDLYTARLTGCENERVLGFNTATRKFGIFSGSTGEFVDSTTAIEGNIAYLIKQPNRLDEIVTIDANRLVRIYGSMPSSPQNVVCYYSPADSMIQLSWSPVFGATSYYVFSRPFCSETDEEWIGEVAGDTTCLVPISYTRECFRVSAVAQ